MAKQQPQYVVITKQRKKSGCIGGIFHLIGGLFTLGLWPLMVWLSHLIGPKRKEVATVYGPTPPAQPDVRSYVPPSSQPWNQPTQQQPNPQATQPPHQWPPQQQPPDDPWDTGNMRRRS